MEAYSLRLSFVQYGCLTHHTLNRFVELFNVVNLFVSFLTRTERQKKKKKKEARTKNSCSSILKSNDLPS